MYLGLYYNIVYIYGSLGWRVVKVYSKKNNQIEIDNL